MDKPDAVATGAPSAPVFVRRRARRLQATTPDNSIHGRIARSLALTNHRVPTDDPGAAPNVVNIRIRQVRTGKPEIRGTDHALHTIHILSPCRTLGRILRKHCRAGPSLPLPDPSLA